MFKGYKYFLTETQNSTKDKVDYTVIGQYVANEIIYCFIAFIFYYLLITISIRLFPLAILLLILFIIFIFRTRYASLGITNKKLIIVKFSRIRKEIKKIYEVPIDEIKYFDYKKFLHINTFRISFFSREGNFVKYRFRFASYYLGKDMALYKKNYEGLVKELVKIQKVLDKGDF